MSARKTTRPFLFTISGWLFLAAFAGILTALAGAEGPPGPTPVEHESRWWPKSQGGALGTVVYRPSTREQPFFNRLGVDEVVTGSHIDDYDVSTRDQKYVGWFGIVREIDEDARAGRTVLTVEHKYFDGLTDAHIQAVSFNGSGDFHATLSGMGHRIPPLSLVKVYGTVAKGKQGTLPRIDAEFVRNWHWGTFTFLDAYGTQRGSEEWRKANQVSLDDIYDPWPHPCHHYYEKRLGKRPDAAEIRKRLLDAAGPLSPEPRQAMEWLADFLALGDTWSQAETIRQSNEFSQICKLIKATGSHKAATDLLIQALQEIDERISWSASEKFAAVDPAGDSIGILVKLLDHETARVRAGAARAVGSGYGARGAPAVAALSRCVAETDPELKWYAILALLNIGPGAKAAVPALKNVLADDGQETRVDAARALWHIDQQPEDVIPVLVAILEDRDAEQRIVASEQLQEMGPWAAPALPALIKALQDEDWVVRSTMVQALGEIGPAAAPAAAALVAALESDEDSIVRSNAAKALGKIQCPTAIPALIAALDNEDDYVRSGAISALEAFGHEAKAALPALIRAVKSDDWAAAGALGSIDAEGISVPVLIEALAYDDSSMRRFAAIGLSRLGRRAAAAENALHDGLHDSDPDARVAAAAAYWSVSGKADAPVRILRAAIQPSSTWATRMGAANALAEIGPAAKAAIPELIACLKSDTQYVVTSSVAALGKMGPDAASTLPDLTTLLNHSDDHYTRVYIARALWRIDSSETSPPVLQDALANSRDSMALSEAARAIGEIGPQAAASVPRLRLLLKDGDSFVRKAAAEAIKQIEGE